MFTSPGRLGTSNQRYSVSDFMQAPQARTVSRSRQKPNRSDDTFREPASGMSKYVCHHLLVARLRELTIGCGPGRVPSTSFVALMRSRPKILTPLLRTVAAAVLLGWLGGSGLLPCHTDSFGGRHPRFLAVARATRPFGQCLFAPPSSQPWWAAPRLSSFTLDFHLPLYVGFGRPPRWRFRRLRKRTLFSARLPPWTGSARLKCALARRTAATLHPSAAELFPPAPACAVKFQLLFPSLTVKKRMRCAFIPQTLNQNELKK